MLAMISMNKQEARSYKSQKDMGTGYQKIITVWHLHFSVTTH